MIDLSKRAAQIEIFSGEPAKKLSRIIEYTHNFLGQDRLPRSVFHHETINSFIIEFGLISAEL